VNAAEWSNSCFPAILGIVNPTSATSWKFRPFEKLLYLTVCHICWHIWITSSRNILTKINSMAWVRERTIPTGRPPLLGEVSANRGCYVVSVTDPYGLILGFLDRSHYFYFQVAPQLYSRGWLDPVPDPLLLRKSGSVGNRTRDLCFCSQELHRNTEAVQETYGENFYTLLEFFMILCIYIYIYIYTSCTRPRVAVAYSGEMEDKEERGSARFTYV
jgi:hypothetical protein